jgi:hypothetical protein
MRNHECVSDTNRTVEGVSLVGLLLVVVTLGILMAGAIVGLHSMTNTTSGAGPAANAAAAANLANGMSRGDSPNIAGVHSGVACTATANAARSASTLYFTNTSGKYPARWSDLTTSSPRVFRLPNNAAVNGVNARELDGPGWKLLMSGGGTTAPTFACG